MREILSQKPINAVDDKKMLHIVNTINEFLCEYMDNNYVMSLTPRIDIIEITSKDGVVVSCRHNEDVVGL